MPELVPAILTKDHNEVFEQLEFLEQFDDIKTVQIDFADGRFVPNTTVMPNQIETLHGGFDLEAHMMLAEPVKYFHNLELLDTKTAVLHHESFDTDESLMTALQNLKSLGMDAGLAINPNTPVETVDQFADQVDMVLVMGVNPGFQGQEFIPETLDRVKLLHSQHPDVIIEVDGGVKLDNFQQVLAAGADRVVVGSGIWVTVDPAETIGQFLKKINKLKN